MTTGHWFLIKLANSLELSLDETHKLSFLFLEKKLSRASVNNILTKAKNDNKFWIIQRDSYRNQIKNIKGNMFSDHTNKNLFGHIYTACTEISIHGYLFFAVERYTGWVIAGIYKPEVPEGPKEPEFDAAQYCFDVAQSRFLKCVSDELPMKISHWESEYQSKNTKRLLSTKFPCKNMLLPLSDEEIERGRDAKGMPSTCGKEWKDSFEIRIKIYNQFIATFRTFNRTPKEVIEGIADYWESERPTEKFTKLLPASFCKRKQLEKYLQNLIQKYLPNLIQKDLNFVLNPYRKQFEDSYEIVRDRARQELFVAFRLLFSSLILKCYPISKLLYVEITEESIKETMTEKEKEKVKDLWIEDPFFKHCPKDLLKKEPIPVMPLFPHTKSNRYELYNLTYRKFFIQKWGDISSDNKLGHIVITTLDSKNTESILFIAIDKNSNFSWNKRMDVKGKDKIESILNFLTWLQSRVKFKILSVFTQLDFILEEKEYNQLNLTFEVKEHSQLELVFGENENNEFEKYCKENMIKLLMPASNKKQFDSNVLSDYLPSALVPAPEMLDKYINKRLKKFNRANFPHLERLRKLDKETNRPRRYNKDLTPVGAFKLLMRCNYFEPIMTNEQ